jgi:hypothetical protein
MFHLFNNNKKKVTTENNNNRIKPKSDDIKIQRIKEKDKDGINIKRENDIICVIFFSRIIILFFCVLSNESLFRPRLLSWETTCH